MSTTSLQAVPQRPTAQESQLLDRSRERLLEHGLPFHSTAAGAVDPGFYAFLPGVDPSAVRRTRTVMRLTETSEADGGGSSAKSGETAASAKSHTQVTTALNGLQLTPIQRLSIRDYVGEKKAEVTDIGTMNGKQVLVLKDPATHAYIGEATVSVRDDGSVVVTKLTGATFSEKNTLELPISQRQTEDAEKTLSGTKSLSGFNSEKSTPGIELSVPAFSVEHSAQLGPVAESTAVFNKDGSGYERGMRTNLASVSVGAEAGVSGKATGDGFVGVKAGGSDQLFKVEVFGNYFSAPEADEKGEFTRSVLGASGEAHVTLAELSGQAGCGEEDGCKLKASAGFLGIGTGLGLNYGANVKLERGSSAGIPEEGMASDEQQLAAADKVPPASVQPPAPETASTPEPAEEDVDEEDAADEDGDAIDDQEQADYEAAVEDGSVEKLDAFLSKYPDSVYDADVREEKEDASDPDQVPGDETKIY